MEERLRAFLGYLDSLEERDGKENGFSKEFNEIKKHLASISDQPEFRTEAGKVRENFKKNRYKDILPFDQTRVPLSLLLDQGYSDYINANFIRGIDGERYYIATQGPLGQTVVDFWRMVWEFRVKVIVMACREIEHGKKKCERYWATEEESVTFGPFTITNVGEETLRNEVIIRTLSVTLLEETRSIRHFQYTAWPDHGIPQDFDSLLEMIGLIHQSQERLSAPICVHCSAGCGRTGVICTVDYVRSLLQRKLIGEGFSVLGIVREMRRQRPAVVQTKDQYEFVYRIVSEMFRKELAGEDHDYENWREDPSSSHLKDVKQHLLSKPLTAPRPLSLPKKAGRPQAAESKPTDDGMGDTYATVAHPRAAGARAAAAPRLPSGHDYENMDEAARAGSKQTLYSTVIVKETAPSPSPRAKDPPGPRAAMSYATIRFGEAAPDSHRPHSSLISSDADSESWAPSLPQRTSDSYIVEDADQLRRSSSSGSDGKSSGKLRNVFKLGFVGVQGKKVPDRSPSEDDGYEDVSCLSSSVTTFSSSSGLGYNTRVSKPRGPRDPPQEWALYER